LGAVLIFGFLDFPVGFEIDDSPALKFRGVLRKGKIDHVLYKRVIFAIVLEGSFAPQGFGFSRSLDERMFEGAAYCRDRSLNLLGGRI
jgi:hypothetical protein